MKKKTFTWRSQLCIVHYALALPTFLTLGHLRASSHAARLIGMLCILMLSGLSMSCSDDDDDKEGRTPEEIAQDPYEKESEAADALYRLVSQLSVCDSLPDDWKTATFEPRLGQVLDESQPRVRTITVANAAEAITRYNSLTGKDLPETATGDTYKVDGVGTLTLNVGGIDAVATIDVNVKQMPQLAQLRMVNASDIGENGTFIGEPYYHFGDVVRDKDDCYWICVRPASSTDKKEDTHWMSFQLNEKENIKLCYKSNCWKQKYPVNLGVQKEKMQYLAQLLAIMADPDAYKEWAGAKGGKFAKGTGLGGLKEDAMGTDNLVNLAWLWELHNVWNKIQPVGIENDDERLDFIESFTEPVRFIYEKGSISGTKLTIPYVEYSGEFYSNAPTYKKATIDMTNESFNVNLYYATNGLRQNKNSTVPDAYVVRYKTGFQLSSNWMFSPKPTESIPGVYDVFLYNKHKNEVNAKGLDIDHVIVGNVLAKNGEFFINGEEANRGGGAVAVVVYVGPKYSVETGAPYRGLALAVDNLGIKGVSKYAYTQKETMFGVCGTVLKTTERDKFRSCLDGLAQTELLASGCGKNHVHPAAEACINDTRFLSPALRANNNLSNWFIPSVGQWILMAESFLELHWDGTKFKETGDAGVLLNRAFDLAGIFGYTYSTTYDPLWTSTDLEDKQCWNISFFEEGLVFDKSQAKIFSYPVMPMIAF